MRHCLLLSLIILCGNLHGQAPTTLSDRITATVNRYTSEYDFAGTILVARAGQPIYQESYGLAYYATPDTLRNNYHYSIASVTKLFTSIRILQLVAAGRIDLRQSVGTYLPKLAEAIPADVSIHDLLLHLSGLPEEKSAVYRRVNTPHAIVAQVLKKNKAGRYGQFNYNNVDYMLLGLVIEAVTGNAWQQEIENAILRPLKLEQTGFLKYGYYPKNFAYTYRDKGGKLQQDPLFYIENFYAAGSMYSTANDLLRLDQALYTEKLLGAPEKQLLAQSYPEYNYAGYSVWNYQYPFVTAKPTVMERRGGILGANVVLVRLTDDNYTIIILSNDDRFNPDSFGDEDNLREMLIRTLYAE
ncbi:MAG: serine hydrolase domain-containing protein [Bacteroidota bacterium]